MKNSRYFFGLVIIGVAIITVNACSASSTTPASTVSPAPTDTSIPTATSVPTTQPAPTATLMLDPQDFYGTWTIFDTEARGPNFLTFNEDRTFTAAHGPEQGQLLHEGTYTLDGNKITFLSWWYCEPDQRVATYLIRMYPDNKSVRFFPVDDPCEERAYEFTNLIIKWNRFIPTTTPSP